MADSLISSPMKKYLYAIIDSGRAQEFVFNGLDGGKVYVLSYKSIGAVISDLGRTKNELNEDHIITHESVVEGLMSSFTVLPVRFFTLMTAEADVLLMLERHYDDFVDNLDKVKGMVELGIKVIWPAEEIKYKIVNVVRNSICTDMLSLRNFNNSVTAAKQYRIGTKNRTKVIAEAILLSPGKRYLMEKFGDYSVDKEVRKEAQKYVDLIDAKFSKYAQDKKLMILKTERLLLSASYLVRKDETGEFKGMFDCLQSEFKGFQFMFSGPWPAYNFISKGEG